MIQSILLLWEKQSSFLKEKTQLGLAFPPSLSLILRYLGTVLKDFWMVQNMVVFTENYALESR